jgi:hypothetical protein
MVNVLSAFDDNYLLISDHFFAHTAPLYWEIFNTSPVEMFIPECQPLK